MESTRPAKRFRLYVPRQHGAWALLAVPLLVGIAASRPTPADLLLAVAAATGYTLAATLTSAAAARDRRPYVASTLVFGSIAAATGAWLIVLAPELLLAGAVVVPASIATVWLGSRRQSRVLAASLASAAQAAVLAPCGAWLGGVTNPADLARLTFVASAYVFGSVLAVRSVIRERGNDRFWLASVLVHLGATAVAWFVLPLPAAVLLLALCGRAASLPFLARAMGRRGKPLRPAFVGLEEMVAGIALIAITLVARP